MFTSFAVVSIPGNAPSPLSLPGAEDTVIELFSFAKSYHLGEAPGFLAVLNCLPLPREDVLTGALCITLHLFASSLYLHPGCI